MIVFDTETTGLVQPTLVPLDQQPEIIELGAVRLHDDTLEELDAYTTLVKPKKLPLDPKITQITGLTSTDLQDQKPFAGAYPELCRFFVGERTLVGHNLDFDRSLLWFELLRLDRVKQFPWPWEHKCTVELTFHLNGYRLSQDKLYQHFCGTPPAGAHRALNDVRNLAEVIRHMRSEGLI